MRIVTSNLTKIYRAGVFALNNVNLEIRSGMFGLLGPNGAGKTTLLNILATLVQPSYGTARIDGFDVSDPKQKWIVRKTLGYLPQELELYPDLTAAEFLEYVAVLKGFTGRTERRREVGRLLGLVGLDHATGQKTKHLSGGMKRRLGIAQALIGNPKLLIVDEPTVGLDPEERVRFRILLAELASERIVLLSTHIVEDIAATCDQLAVLKGGRLLFTGSPRELQGRAKGLVWEMTMPPSEQANPRWAVVTTIRSDMSTKLRVIGERPTPNAQIAGPTLEEGYLALISAAKQSNSYDPKSM